MIRHEMTPKRDWEVVDMSDGCVLFVCREFKPEASDFPFEVRVSRCFERKFTLGYFAQNCTLASTPDSLERQVSRIMCPTTPNEDRAQLASYLEGLPGN